MDKFANLDAEKTLVNQMILDSSIIPNVYDEIKPETFYSATYKKCYETLLSLMRKCTPIDELSFRTECKGYIQPEIIEEVTNATFTAANWGYYAGEIKQCYSARAIRNLLTEQLNNLTVKNGSEIANFVMTESAKISENTSACEVHDMNELAQEFIINLEKAIQNKQEYTGIPTGFKNIDDITLGLQPEYIVIGARPSMGKTALGEQMALYMARHGTKVGFIELEMSSKQLTERGVANTAKVSINKLRTGMLTTAQLSKVALKAGELGNLENFVPITCNTRKLADICSCIRREVRINGLKAVFIDHIGLIHPVGSYKNQWEGVGEISHTLQQLNRELGIPVVALSQVGRAVEGKKPSLADLRGSGAIEEDADQVWLIDRDRQESDDQFAIPAAIGISKNRNGACGTAHLVFHPQEVMFTDAEKSEWEAPDMNKAVKEPERSPAEDFLAGGTPSDEFVM